MLLVQWDVTLMDVITNSRAGSRQAGGQGQGFGQSRAVTHSSRVAWELQHVVQSPSEDTYKMGLALPC